MDLNQHQSKSSKREFINIFLNNFSPACELWVALEHSFLEIVEHEFSTFFRAAFIVLTERNEFSLRIVKCHGFLVQAANATTSEINLYHNRCITSNKYLSSSWAVIDSYRLSCYEKCRHVALSAAANTFLIAQQTVYCYLMILGDDDDSKAWQSQVTIVTLRLPSESSPTHFFPVEGIQYLFSFGLAS